MDRRPCFAQCPTTSWARHRRYVRRRSTGCMPKPPPRCLSRARESAARDDQPRLRTPSATLATDAAAALASAPGRRPAEAGAPISWLLGRRSSSDELPARSTRALGLTRKQASRPGRACSPPWSSERCATRARRPRVNSSASAGAISIEFSAPGAPYSTERFTARSTSSGVGRPTFSWPPRRIESRRSHPHRALVVREVRNHVDVPIAEPEEKLSRRPPTLSTAFVTAYYCGRSRPPTVGLRSGF